MDDLEIRDEEVKEILKYIGAEFKIDWSVTKETGSKHNTHDLEITNKQLNKVPERFIEFYASTIELSTRS